VAKRPTGKMIPITDEDIQNLEFIQAAAKTMKAMAEWTGFSRNTIQTWMTAKEYHVRWHVSTQRKITKIAEELNPTPAARMPVFTGSKIAHEILMDLAIKMRGQDGELELLRLAVDLMKEGR